MKSLILVLNLMAGTDTSLTHVALKNGAREVIYPTQNPYAIHGINLGQQLAFNYALPKMKNKKLAKGIAIGLIIARGIAIINNVKVVNQLRK